MKRFVHVGLLPSRVLTEQAHLLDPTLTPADFMRALKAADDTGHALLEPYDTPAALEAAKPFVLRNASGIPCVSMALAASNRAPNPKQTSGFLAPEGVAWKHGESRIIQGLARLKPNGSAALSLVSGESEKPETYTRPGRSIPPYTVRADLHDLVAEETKLIIR